MGYPSPYELPLLPSVSKLLYPTFQHNVNTIYCHCLLPVLLHLVPTLYQTRCSPDSPTDVPARVEGGGDQHGPHPARDPPHPGAPATGLSGQPELRQEKSRRSHARRPRPQAWREGAARGHPHAGTRDGVRVHAGAAGGVYRSV